MTHAPALLAAPIPAGQSPEALFVAAQNLLAALERGKRLDAPLLRAAMESAFGDSDAQGAWDWKMAYDACEAATVLFLRKFGPAMQARAGSSAALLPMLTKIAGLLPTHTRRSEESQALQQFSTPIALGHAARVADMIRDRLRAYGLFASEARARPRAPADFGAIWIVGIGAAAVRHVAADFGHAGGKRSQKEQDGSEIRSVELERLTAEGQTLIERRNSMEFFRDQAADQFERHLHSAWRPRAGSMVNHRALTSAMIDSRDFLAAKRRSENEVLLPAGPKVALTGGLDFNDHRLIWDKLDKVFAKHPDMVLLHGGSPKGTELIAARSERVNDNETAG